MCYYLINMEPEQTSPVPDENTQADKFANLKKVTPLSKYLAMALFVLLPFVGGYIGYKFAPEKIVETAQPTLEVKSFKSTLSSPSLEELQQKFSDQIESRLTIEPLYTTSGGVQYFKSFIPESSNCCGVYKFLSETQSFHDTGIRIDMMIGEEASLSGRYIPKVVEGVFLDIYDLETQSREVSISELSDVKSLVSSTCGYAGKYYDLEWKDEHTLQYGLYKAAADSEICPEMQLLEHKLIDMDKSASTSSLSEV